MNPSSVSALKRNLLRYQLSILSKNNRIFKAALLPFWSISNQLKEPPEYIIQETDTDNCLFRIAQIPQIEAD